MYTFSVSSLITVNILILSRVPHECGFSETARIIPMEKKEASNVNQLPAREAHLHTCLPFNWNF